MLFRSGVSPSTKEISLPHEHRFSQLNIRIKCVSNTDPETVRRLNPTVLINDTYTMVDYHFNNHLFSNYRARQSIIPYGQWVVDDKMLVGKKCILIPQLLPAETLIATLVINDKTYDCKLPYDYNLENGKSHELTLYYDASLGVSEISTSINDWKQGENSSITAVNRDEKEYLSINELNFNESNVFHIKSKGKFIVQFCKELLYNDLIDHEAIVIYRAKNGVIDESQGIVWRIWNDKTDCHGGNVLWEKITNNFEYIPGNKPLANDIFFGEDSMLYYQKPQQCLMIAADPDLLSDYRINEIIKYPIVKIGTSYWMREDLRASRYNNGKAITLKTTSGFTKKSAGYFKEGSFIFYNKAALSTGNLAPSDWRIASINDWERLNSYIKGKSSYLKECDKWLDIVYDSFNYSGFSSLPTGYFGEASGGGESKYVSNQYTAYWQMNNANDNLAETAIILRYDMYQLRPASYTAYSGYCVLCVRE